MKKTLFVLFFVVMFFTNFSLTFFANESEINTKVNKKEPSKEESKTVLGTKKYDVVLNGINVGKSVTVKEYSKKCLDYISLRELVESLNGKINWYPDYSSWNDDIKSRVLGDFELFENKFKFYSCATKDIDPIYDDREYLYWLQISTEIDGQNVTLPMSNFDEDLDAKVLDGRIYVSMEFMTRLFSRLGYMGIFDKDTKIFNVKKYNPEEEKRIVLEKFQGNQFESIPYRFYENKNDTVYETKAFERTTCILYDVFHAMASKTISTEYLYRKYIGYNYKLGYKVNINKERFLKDMLEAYYMKHFDDIYIKYDEDLNIYIISNKNFENINDIDDTSKFILIRDFDYMLLN